MSRHHITYVSDQGGDYVAAIGKVKTLAELMHVLEDYKSLCPDALEAAPKDDKEFKAWRQGLHRERRGEYAGDAYLERYGAIMLPELLMQVAAVVARFHVPWGCAYLRMVDAGMIKVVDGVSRYYAKEQAA